ncbi:MAG TPA: 4-alpha-glucanotransferase [Candidatus Sulfotelmatobacter sp.]|nr:4-alpha-glucanotransferase [Candidatus Sulfotelmatobacter sp.]
MTTAGDFSSPPYSADSRASGLLLHVTSLPSPYGIGDLGAGAFSWIDRLSAAGQRWWQALPVGPTGYGNSPYQSLSSFAGNALLISPGELIVDELLGRTDLEEQVSNETIDYGRVIPAKNRLIEIAWTNFKKGRREDLRPVYEQFCQQQAHWLDDYALFRALKVKYNGASYLDWPADLVERKPRALASASHELTSIIDPIRFAQFLLQRQADCVLHHAHATGVGLIGDLPFFVSPDSSDVWAHPEFFLVDELRRPRFVAGVPPDYFSAQGQLWGNPVYNWDALRATGYRWCIDRIRALLAHVDVIRLDHFRGFVAAWHVPRGAATAQTGEWVAGPGMAFFRAIRKELGRLPFTAEDLGIITPEVRALRDELAIPGTRVLQFAFDGHSDNPYLPHNYVPNTVVYTGTHDNATTLEWYEDLPGYQRQNLWNYLGRAYGEPLDVSPAMIRLAWSSQASLAITPLQDLLNLGRGARMNVPGRAEGNWSWRCSPEMLSAPAFDWLSELTRESKRESGSSGPPSGQTQTTPEPVAR